MAAALDLSGRVAIVTGGSRGIGREVCLALARHGASVVICYQRNAQKAAEVVSEIEQFSGKAIAVQADVATQADVIAVFEKTEEAFRRVHIVVNAAGIILSSCPLERTSVEDWDRIFSVNARGNFLLCKEAAKRVVRGGGGRIITFSSSMVHMLNPGYAAYVASKAAVEATTKMLAKELKGRSITANCVAPGPIATDLFLKGKDQAPLDNSFKAAPPLERFGDAKDIAALVLFLVSDGGEWVNGQVIRANGGLII